MFNLIKDFGITALIIILNHFVYSVEDVIAYDFVVGFLARNQAFFLAIAVLGSGALLFFTAIEGLGLYKVTYGLSKVFIRVSQLLVTFLCITNIAFYLMIGMNLMRDGGYISLCILALVLGSSCWALRIIDFNYHIRNSILPVAIVAIMSVILVEFLWPLIGL